MSRKQILINGKQLSDLIVKFVGNGSNVNNYETTSVSGDSDEALYRVALVGEKSYPKVLHNVLTGEYYIKHISPSGILNQVDVIYINTREGYYRTYDATIDMVPVLGINTLQFRSILEMFVALPV